MQIMSGSFQFFGKLISVMWEISLCCEKYKANSGTWNLSLRFHQNKAHILFNSASQCNQYSF